MGSPQPSSQPIHQRNSASKQPFSTNPISDSASGTPVNLPPGDFFHLLLDEILRFDGVIAGQVWGLNQIGKLIRVTSTDQKRFQGFEHAELIQEHRDLISQCLFSRKRSSVSFKTASPVNSSESNAAPEKLSEQFVYFIPLVLGEESVGVIELILIQNLESPEARKRLDELVADAESYLLSRATQPVVPKSAIDSRDHSLPNPAAEKPIRRDMGQHDPAELHRNSGQMPESLAPSDEPESEPESDVPQPSPENATGVVSAFDVEAFTLLLHNQSDLAYVAATAVAEIRRLVQCDRVCLAARNNGVTDVVAISGQDEFSSKSNMVVSLKKLAEQVIESGQEISFELGNQLSSVGGFDSMVNYLDESNASWVKVIPLYEPEKIDFESNSHQSEQTVFAALFVELFSDRPRPNSQDLQRLAPHIAQAACHALDLENILLLPTRRRLGQFARKSKLTRSRMTLIGLLVAGLAAALTFVQAPYHVKASGRLMPVEQFRAYAPFDGQVQNVLVESGQVVAPGQSLLAVVSENLATQHLVLTNDHGEKSKLLYAYKAQLDDSANQLPPSGVTSLNAKIAQLVLEVEGLNQQRKLLEQLMHRSDVQSTIRGTVATFRPGDLLKQRPVGRGELLLEVMNEEGPWHLELELPEKRVGFLLDQMQRAQPPGVELTFLQATNPEQSFAATVSEVSNRVSVGTDGSATVSIHASIEPNQSLRKTIGADVIAKIQCGKKSLGYVWFGDIIDWARQAF